jgi:hypothetical protein
VQDPSELKIPVTLSFGTFWIVVEAAWPTGHSAGGLPMVVMMDDSKSKLIGGEYICGYVCWSAKIELARL